MPKLNDLTNNIYNRLTVINRTNNDKQDKPMWNCLCSCGNALPVRALALRKGTTKSCGCLRKEISTNTMTTHGKTGSPELKIWYGIRKRINNTKDINYKNYGGRGIQLCKHWQQFTHFLTDMGKRPSPKHTIERRDVNGNYEPSNCYWATYKEQNNNTRTVRYFTYLDKTQTLTQWCDELNLYRPTVHQRVAKGWTIQRALETKTARKAG